VILKIIYETICFFTAGDIPVDINVILGTDIGQEANNGANY
jgi:hypothetical protein